MQELQLGLVGREAEEGERGAEVLEASGSYGTSNQNAFSHSQRAGCPERIARPLRPARAPAKG